MNWCVTFLLVAVYPLAALADSFSRDFAVVFANAETEARHGSIPFDRALLAQAVEKVADAGARGLIIKFYLDRPRNADSDQRLANAMSRIPTVLQARIDDSEETSNPLPARFTTSGGALASSVRGRNGWIPTPLFSARAANVCFADFASTVVPLVEIYRNRTVQSLLLCSVELGAGRRATFNPAERVSFGRQSIPLDANNRVTLSLRGNEPMLVHSFHDLLEGVVHESVLKGKIVVLAYDGPNIHSVETPVGRLGAHRMFVSLLRELYNNMAPNQALHPDALTRAGERRR